MSKITSELIKDVLKAIHEHKDYTSNLHINLLEQDGVITLEGEVPSLEAKETVEKITTNQPGVTGVINNLDINRPDKDPISDLDIETELKNPPPQHISLGK